MLKLFRVNSLFSQLVAKRPSTRCMVIHPVAYPNKGPLIEQYLAEEAIGLASSLGWQIIEGPFWNSQKINKEHLSKDVPHNHIYMEPEYGDEIKDGTYIHTSIGSGVFFKDGIIFDEFETESDGDLHSEWKNKVLRESLATSSLLKCKKITQKYFFTKGKIEKIVSHVINTKIDCIFVNSELKPGQIRNLKKLIEARLNNTKLPKNYSIGLENEEHSETELDSTEEVQEKTSLRERPPLKKVQIFDRFSIILQIFAQRTTSKLAQLQIELSYLAYLKTRLVRDGSTYSSNLNFFSGNLLTTQEINLEIISARQRRALGVMSGEGESQLEIERRNIRDKEAKIRREIEEQNRLRQNRKNKDKKRNSEVPVIALVGYTNVGKSAFMNYVMGKQEVESKDLLFQTLKTTSRYITLPSGTQAALLDTIGFITDLPIQMIDAFKTTLEDISHADIVIHLRDCSHPHNDLQKESVIQILKELKFEPNFYTDKMIEVWNKADLLTDADAAPSSDAIQISCVTGKNIKKLLTEIDVKLREIRGLKKKQVTYPYKHHHFVVEWLKANANLSYDLNEQHDYETGTVTISLDINEATEGKLMKQLDQLKGVMRDKSQKRNKGMPPKEGW